MQRILHIVIYKHTSLIDETEVFGWFLNMIVCIQVFVNKRNLYCHKMFEETFQLFQQLKKGKLKEL